MIQLTEDEEVFIVKRRIAENITTPDSTNKLKGILSESTLPYVAKLDALTKVVDSLGDTSKLDILKSLLADRFSDVL